MSGDSRKLGTLHVELSNHVIQRVRAVCDDDTKRATAILLTLSADIFERSILTSGEKEPIRMANLFFREARHLAPYFIEFGWKWEWPNAKD